MSQIFLEGMTVETLSDIIRQTVKEEISNKEATKHTLEANASGYLTRKQTASRLKVSLVTLTEWVNRSRLKAYKIGGRVLFRESEVEEALSQIVPLKNKRR